MLDAREAPLLEHRQRLADDRPTEAERSRSSGLYGSLRGAAVVPTGAVRPHGEALQDSLRNLTVRRLICVLAEAAEPASALRLSMFSSFLHDSDAPVEEIHVRDAEVLDGGVVSSELGQQIRSLVVVGTHAEVLGFRLHRGIARDSGNVVEPQCELPIDERGQPLEVGLARPDPLDHGPGDLAYKRRVALTAADPAQRRGDRLGYPRARRCSCQYAVVKLSCPCRQRRRTRLRRNRNTIPATLDDSRPPRFFLATDDHDVGRAMPGSSGGSRLLARPERSAHPNLELNVVIQAHAAHLGTHSVHHGDRYVQIIDVEQEIPGPSSRNCRPDLEHVVAKRGDNASACGLPIREHHPERRLKDGELFLLRGLEVRGQPATHHEDPHRRSLGHPKNAWACALIEAHRPTSLSSLPG